MQGHQLLDQAAQNHIQTGLESLQGWGIHNLLGQPVPALHHPLGEKLPPNIQPKPPLSQFKTIPPHVDMLLSMPQRGLLDPSLLQAKQARFPQPFLIGEVLQPSDHLSGPLLDLLQGSRVQIWVQLCSSAENGPIVPAEGL